MLNCKIPALLAVAIPTLALAQQAQPPPPAATSSDRASRPKPAQSFSTVAWP